MYIINQHDDKTKQWLKYTMTVNRLRGVSNIVKSPFELWTIMSHVVRMYPGIRVQCCGKHVHTLYVGISMAIQTVGISCRLHSGRFLKTQEPNFHKL